MQASLSLPWSASSLKSLKTRQERERERYRQTRGSPRGEEATLYTSNSYKGGGAESSAVSRGDMSTETATMRSGAVGDTSTSPSECGKYSGWVAGEHSGGGELMVREPKRNLGPSAYSSMPRTDSPRGPSVATSVHDSPLNPSAVVAGVRLRASAGGGGDQDEGCGSEVREVGGGSEAVLRAPRAPQRQMTAEFAQNSCKSSLLSLTHAGHNTPPTAASSRYAGSCAGQLPPIMISPKQFNRTGGTFFLGPSSLQPQPPAGERGGQMEGGRGGGKGLRGKRALNRERDVVHVLIAHGTADCRKVLAPQSHTYVHTCICTYKYLHVLHGHICV